MRSSHTDEVSDDTLELTGDFLHSFTPSSAESWGLQQWEQTEKENPSLVFGIPEDIKVLNANIFFNKVKSNWEWEERREKIKRK